MKSFLFLILSVFAFNALALDFPKGPDSQVTPGALCTSPSSYRYAEQIPYCERDVSTQLKGEIFEKVPNQYLKIKTLDNNMQQVC